MAEPAVTAPFCTVGDVGARTLAGVSKLSCTPLEQRSECEEVMRRVDPDPVTAHEKQAASGDDGDKSSPGQRTVNLGAGQIVPYPEPKDEAATKVGKGNRRTGTKPEMRLRSALHRHGHRFRKDHLLRPGALRVRPDIVFTRWRVAVFVDGCFWHGCPEHQHIPKTNRDYWAPKLAANVARDRRVDTALAQAGWVVVRIWEHVPLGTAVEVVEDALRTQREMPGP